jgi:hypothetical protein
MTEPKHLIELTVDPPAADERALADERVVACLQRMLKRAEAGELLAIAFAGEHDVYRVLGALYMLRALILSRWLA